MTWTQIWVIFTVEMFSTNWIQLRGSQSFASVSALSISSDSRGFKGDGRWVTVTPQRRHTQEEWLVSLQTKLRSPVALQMTLNLTFFLALFLPYFLLSYGFFILHIFKNCPGTFIRVSMCCWQPQFSMWLLPLFATVLWCTLWITSNS